MHERTQSMASKIVELLGYDVVAMLECLFDSGKTLHDYKIGGNVFGSTIVLRLADPSKPSYHGYSMSKSPAKQQRDTARQRMRCQHGEYSSPGKGDTEFKVVERPRSETKSQQTEWHVDQCDSTSSALNMASSSPDYFLPRLSHEAQPFLPKLNLSFCDIDIDISTKEQNNSYSHVTKPEVSVINENDVQYDTHIVDNKPVGHDVGTYVQYDDTEQVGATQGANNVLDNVRYDTKTVDNTSGENDVVNDVYNDTKPVDDIHSENDLLYDVLYDTKTLDNTSGENDVVNDTQTVDDAQTCEREKIFVVNHGVQIVHDNIPTDNGTENNVNMLKYIQRQYSR